MDWINLGARVAIAVIAGFVIGFEREINHKPAGLRTHVLVSLGSALFVLSSVHIAYTHPQGTTFDPSRVAAGVVTGVGFLGAGAILQTKHHVKGLTTAASIWVSASLGIAAGLGAYKVVVLGLTAAIIVLAALYPIENRVLSTKNQNQDDFED